MEEEKKGTATAEQGDENTKNQETLESLNPEPEKDQEKDEKYLGQKRRAEKAEAEAKALQEEISKLRTSSMTGSMPVAEVNDKIKKLGEEYGVDESFLTKLVSTIESSNIQKIKAELEKDYAPKLSRLEQERALEKAEKKFDDVFSKVLKDMPEYDGVVNKEVIKALAFNPANAKKTMPQILEEAYGNAIQGRKSIESTHASREPEEVNFSSPKGSDWDKIESDPVAKKKWAEETEKQIRQYL